MENKLTVFSNEDFGTVRAVMINDEPYFVAKDVANSLGYGNPRDAVTAHVKEKNRLVIQKSDFPTLDIPNRGLTLINESGLYSLIMRSKLPSAEIFQDWVTSEVLPSIRKDGVYATDDWINKALDDPDFAIAALNRIKEQRKEIERLGGEVLARQRLIEDMTPKADYYDKILSSTATLSATQIAKDYGMSPQQLNSILHDLGIQYKVNGQWVLYQEYAASKYTDTRTFYNKSGFTGLQTRWTQKGRLFLYENLKAAGHLPLIEQ